MNLRHLRTFVLTAESGGIAHASGRLNLSSPAASRQILALENELRVQLFNRVGRRLQLTSEGEDLLVRSRRLLNDAESLSERARALKSGHTGLLRVGAAPQVIESFLAPFIPQYRRRHSGVDVHLVEDASGNLPMRLERGEVHVIEVPADDERFPRLLSNPTHVLAVLPRMHRLGRRAVLEVTDIAEEPLLLQRRDSQARGWVDAAFKIMHVRPNVLLESAVPHTLVALAAGGYGVAVVPSNVSIPYKDIRAVPLVMRGESIGRWSALAWHPERFLPPYAESFIEEYVAFAPRANPGRDAIRRCPPLPRPKEVGGTISKVNAPRSTREGCPRRGRSRG